MSGDEMEQTVCNCGQVLTAEEILYYGTGCEQCEEAFTVAMQNDAMSECPPDAGCSTASTITVTEEQLRKAIMQVMYVERRYDASQCIHGASSKVWRELGGERP